MKKMLLSLSLAAVLASGSTLTIASGDSVNEGNSLTAANVLITAHPLWIGPLGTAQWISYGPTGYGDPSIPNSPNLSTPVVSFFEWFTISAPIFGNLLVAADDAANVYINGNQIASVGSMLGCVPNPGANPVSCQTSASLNLTPWLVAGPNVLEFQVFQFRADPLGIQYQGTVAHTPEPLSIGLTGAGLIGLVWMRRRQRA